MAAAVIAAASASAAAAARSARAAAGLPGDAEEEPERPPPPAQLRELPPPQDGVEACGDDPWFADERIRCALRDAVDLAHANFKIIVGDPAAEIQRICPGDGRQLKAGAVLRLGGSHLGAFGEADISYAYRQLSRALHPDKNPNNPDAPSAFRRLTEAQDELRASVEAARQLQRQLAAPLATGAASQEELKRPQTALFAQAARLACAVLGLATEGLVPAAARQRALAALGRPADTGGGGWAAPSQGAEALLNAWFCEDTLLAAVSSDPLRSAYDCAPKRYRSHFLCLLIRLVLLESARNEGCVRQGWAGVWETFPELGLWRTLREQLQQKCRVHGRERERSRSPARGKKEEANWSQWARRWRKVISAVLPSGEAAAVPWSDPEVRKLCAALWRDFVDPLEKKQAPDQEAVRCLGLFRSENRGAADVEAQQGAAPADWAFVPAADLLLILGDGMVGITLQGVFAAGGAAQRMPFAMAIFRSMS